MVSERHSCLISVLAVLRGGVFWNGWHVTLQRSLTSKARLRQLQQQRQGLSLFTVVNRLYTRSLPLTRDSAVIKALRLFTTKNGNFVYL